MAELAVELGVIADIDDPDLVAVFGDPARRELGDPSKGANHGCPIGRLGYRSGRRSALQVGGHQS